MPAAVSLYGRDSCAGGAVTVRSTARHRGVPGPPSEPPSWGWPSRSWPVASSTERKAGQLQGPAGDLCIGRRAAVDAAYLYHRAACRGVVVSARPIPALAGVWSARWVTNRKVRHRPNLGAETSLHAHAGMGGTSALHTSCIGLSHEVPRHPAARQHALSVVARRAGLYNGRGNQPRSPDIVANRPVPRTRLESRSRPRVPPPPRHAARNPGGLPSLSFCSIINLRNRFARDFVSPRAELLCRLTSRGREGGHRRCVGALREEASPGSVIPRSLRPPTGRFSALRAPGCVAACAVAARLW
eukprot:353234-Chlamydomonas_euryale.AAC.3